MNKKIRILLIAATCFLSVGCSYKPLIKSLNRTNPFDVARSDTITLEEGSAIKTDQLRLTINSAQLTDYWDGYYVEDPSWRYLIVNVTIKNIYEDAGMLDLYADQLPIRWEDLGNHNIDPEDSYFNEQLADYNYFIKVFKNTSRTGNLIYVVPENINSFQLVHQNYLLDFSAEETSDSYDDYYNYDDYYDSTPVESYDTMATSSFDLTINSLSVLSDYEADGTNGQYVVANITINNTDRDYVSLDFYDYDFTLSWTDFYGQGQYPQSWGDDGPLTEHQLPDSYTIFSGDSKTGDLVFLVPKNASRFALEYYDFYSTYCTYITNTDIDGL